MNNKTSHAKRSKTDPSQIKFAKSPDSPQTSQCPPSKIPTPPKLFGLFGHPAAHSLSPLMQNSAFAHSGYNGIYLPFDVTNIKQAITAMKTLGMKGASVTMPHKETALALLDEIDESAQKAGAVNTILNRRGKLLGANTDATGAVAALSEKVCIHKKSVAIIGAGGAAMAMASGIISKGGRVTIVNRSEKRGEDLARRLGADFLPMGKIETRPFDIIANATPVGMTPETSAMPIPERMLAKGMTIMDAVYNPLKTALIMAAEKAGCITVDGAAMFVYQGAAQFELWTGLPAPVDVMRQAVLKALANGEECDKNAMNIYLIGHRCSGKTSVGKILAAKLGRRFVDMDELMEQRRKMSVAEIIAQHGWDEFRRMERDLITEIVEKKGMVAATGGGAVLDPKNVVDMKKSGAVVWLDASPEISEKRMRNDPKTVSLRPSITGRGAVEETAVLMEQRRALYRGATDHRVGTDQMTLDEVAGAILGMIGH